MDNITDIEDEKTARPYQLRLFDHAIKQNSIIYLPTGSGKTYIAIMIIRHFSKKYTLPINEGGKRCAVLCNTVALARQLVSEISTATNFTVGLFVGDMNVDNWPQSKWKSEITANQVLVGTSQVFLDMASHNVLAVTDLSCVIIDECHHATKSHPMHQFLSLMLYSPQSELPRIVGLTGILLKSTKKADILRPLEDLEAAFRGKIITVENLNEYHNVLVYSTAPKESIIKYVNISPVFDVEWTIGKLISETMEEIQEWNIGEKKQSYSKNLRGLQSPNKIKQANSLLSDFLYQMNDMGLYTASFAIMGLIVQFEVNKRNAETLLLRNMYRYLLTRCEFIRHILVKKIRANNDDDDDDANEADVILNFSKPKLQSLLSYFLKEFTSKKASDICCLLFVQRRYTAKCLCFVIKAFVDAYKALSHISADFMVGRTAGIIYSIDSILDTKWDREAIDRFRRKECNLIVCSSVLEEGIDIQACNYVIAFDTINQFGSYVQMKGRARSAGSNFLVICDSQKASETALKIKQYKETDQKLKQYLFSRTIDREIPEKIKIHEELTSKIKPFISSTGAILQPEAAIMLMHRYCQNLPHDNYTNLNPVWTVISEELGHFQLSLNLPLQSTIKEVIYSDVMRTCKEAKISAAFKACLKLYESGELNENLIPVTKKHIIENVSDIYFSKWKDQPIVDCVDESVKKNHHVYDIFWPKETSPNMPLLNRCSYVYCINTIPKFEKNDGNIEVHELLSSQSNYAIVCSNKLPAFAPMPLYVTQGQLMVEVSNNPTEVTFHDASEINLLKKFTKMIFHDIRKFWKDFLAFSNGSTPNSFLIAPTKSTGLIDWEVVRTFQRLSQVREPSETERARKVYRPEDYLGKVVCTWYNECEDGPRYTVTKVFHDMTPLSPFPDDSGTTASYTFADYVESKYGKRVMQKNQFMIEARPINKRTRFFVNITEKGAETKKKKRINKIILIPEMCHNFHYPADLWLKSLLLPSILHRLYYLQCAEWLRIDINKFLDIPSPPNYSPAPLKIDFSLARVQNEEELEAPRSLLPALDTMRRDDITQPQHAMVDIEQGNWKQHYEPIDVYRNADKVCPIEVDYYYMFVNNLLPDMENLSLECITEQQVSTCNLKPYEPKIDHPYVHDLKKLKYTTEDQGCRIELLEKKPETLTTAEQYEFLAAITTAAANDVFDMERLEVLGDSFLKFIISLVLMNKHPTWNEGFLTATKSKMVSNQNFLYCMRAKYINSFIRTSSFDAKDDWVPPMAAIPHNVVDIMAKKRTPLYAVIKLHLSDNEKETGLCSPGTLQDAFENLSINDEPDDALYTFFFKQSVRDKVMADCLEALMGVCVKNYGVEKSVRMLEYFDIFKDESFFLPNLLKMKMMSARVKPNISQSDIDSYLPNYHILEENLKYKFHDRAYLLQALTHPSFPTNRLTGCYQQLEFIGDAVLDFLISSFIYESCTHMTPGQITDLRSALVNNITLACICIRNRFHQFMLYESPTLADSIKKFVEFQIVQDHRVTDQVKILLEENSSPKMFNMALNVDVPKTLGDIVEAIIGAVFIDSGNDLKCTWDVIYRLLKIEISDFMRDVPIDPVRRLCEYRGANPSFSIYRVEVDVVMIQCTFHCRDLVKTVFGCGSNQLMAKKAAAKMALQILNKN